MSVFDRFPITMTVTANGADQCDPMLNHFRSKGMISSAKACGN